MGGPDRLAETVPRQIPRQRTRESGTDVAGVQGTRDGRVFCALQNGAAIGENRHLIRVDTKTEQEFVVADVGDGDGKPLLQCCQIQRATALVNLYGISAAESDVRLGFPAKVWKFAAGTRSASGIPGDADRLEVAAPNIARDEPVVERVFAAGEKFERFGNFERGDEIDDGAKDANGVAGLFETMAVCRGLEEAGETGS